MMTKSGWSYGVMGEGLKVRSEGGQPHYAVLTGSPGMYLTLSKRKGSYSSEACIYPLFNLLDYLNFFFSVIKMQNKRLEMAGGKNSFFSLLLRWFSHLPCSLRCLEFSGD